MGVPTIEAYIERRNHIRAGRKLWKKNHPGEPVHITRAMEEYAATLGLPKGHFLQRATEARQVAEVKKEWKQEITHELDLKVPCPHCGELMEFQSLPQCLRANPHRFSCVLYCSGDNDCTYHVFVKNLLIDVWSHLRTNGRLRDLNIVEGRV